MKRERQSDNWILLMCAAYTIWKRQVTHKYNTQECVCVYLFWKWKKRERTIKWLCKFMTFRHWLDSRFYTFHIGAVCVLLHIKFRSLSSLFFFLKKKRRPTSVCYCFASWNMIISYFDSLFFFFLLYGSFFLFSAGCLKKIWPKLGSVHHPHTTVPPTILFSSVFFFLGGWLGRRADKWLDDGSEVR